MFTNRIARLSSTSASHRLLPKAKSTSPPTFGRHSEGHDESQQKCYYTRLWPFQSQHFDVSPSSQRRRFLISSSTPSVFAAPNNNCSLDVGCRSASSYSIRLNRSLSTQLVAQKPVDVPKAEPAKRKKMVCERRLCVNVWEVYNIHRIELNVCVFYVVIPLDMVRCCLYSLVNYWLFQLFAFVSTIAFVSVLAKIAESSPKVTRTSHVNRFCVCSHSQAAVKLSTEQRATELEPLLTKGWTLVNGRDAIYKEFIFKDFNQVWIFVG